MKRVLSLITFTVFAGTVALSQEVIRPAADEKKGIEARAGCRTVSKFSRTRTRRSNELL